MPMLYHSFYEAGPEFVKTYTQEALRTVKVPVYSGLYAPPLEAAEFTATVRMAIEGGAAGVSIFDAGAMSPERWSVLSKALPR
jgi:hypothetical protein